MSNRIVTISGVSSEDNHFLVKTNDFNVVISNSVSGESGEGPSPTDFLLAGFAGSINAVGLIVAKELGIELLSLEVEIVGELVTKKVEGKQTRSRAGFRKIEVVVKPVSNAPLVLLKEWIDTVKERCPLRDNLINTTPVVLTLLKEYNKHNAA
ncbi:MAG TPA: OsmC family protein [Flavobacterium sp.]|uniref:OsmC family protein n=1 Tax=Flavobacterium sp. TaxID=239 RepID=UPI002C683F91|nr:OsmC family protein [Flavobacterium sp.]HSD15424.1 OsmC family protein [Flavobacterium sp.]